MARHRSTYQEGTGNLLKAALALFQENGFAATSVRQIADRAGMSLGLINHYFGSKEVLGAQCLQVIDRYVTQRVDSFVSLAQDPILCDLVTVRALFDYMQGGYRRFYLDSLELDFFFKYLSSRPPTLIEELKRFYPIETDDDSILLFSRYLPYMLEKTLMLKKAQGLFPTIPNDQVPLLICTSAMNHFIPEADVKARDAEAVRLAQEIIGGLERTVPERFIEEYAERFAQDIHRAAEGVKAP